MTNLRLHCCRFFAYRQFSLEIDQKRPYSRFGAPGKDPFVSGANAPNRLPCRWSGRAGDSNGYARGTRKATGGGPNVRTVETLGRGARFAKSSAPEERDRAVRPRSG